jgi:hypothetical protein
MNPYPLPLEICGPTARWTRPDTGSSPVSYVAPALQYPFGLDRGNSLLRSGEKVAAGRMRCGAQTVQLRRVRCRFQPCARVQFHRYTTNYGGPLRASDAMNKGASYSLARRTGKGGRRPGEGGRWREQPINSSSATPDHVGPPAEPKPLRGGEGGAARRHAFAKPRTTNCPACCGWCSTRGKAG